MDSYRLPIQQIVAIMLGILLICTILIPVIDGLTAKESEGIYNEGADWIRLAYSDTDDYNLDFSVSGDTVTVGNQTGNADTVLYADDMGCLMAVNGSLYMVAQGNDRNVLLTLGNSVNISRTAGTTTVDNGTESIEYASTWAYYPNDNGEYGYFTEGGATLDDKPLVAISNYAGAFAYNDRAVTDSTAIPITMDAQIEDDVLQFVEWIKAGTLDTQSTMPVLNLDNTFDPSVLNPTVIDNNLGGGMSLMAVPTPTYTDGDWGYELSGNNATIVSYSGTGGTGVDLVIPATVGGYNVVAVGKGGSSQTVVPTSFVGRNLVISDGIQTINGFAFEYCSGFTGSLTIGNSVTTIGDGAFSGCLFFTGLTLGNSVTTIGNSAFTACWGFTGSLTIPNSVTTIGQSAFQSCSGFTGSLVIPDSVTTIGIGAFQSCSGFTGSLVIPDSVTTIGQSAFYNCSNLTSLINLSDATFQSGVFGNTSNLKEVLNLGSTEFTTTSYGLNADSVQDSIDMQGYVAPVDTRYESEDNGMVSTLLRMIPIILFACIATMICRRL